MVMKSEPPCGVRVSFFQPPFRLEFVVSVPLACNKCSMCVTGTFGRSCDYWQAVAQRLDSRFGEGAHLRWWFGEIFPDLDADEILALPEI